MDADIVCLKDNMPITLVLGFYKNNKLVKDSITIKPYTLDIGKNSVFVSVDNEIDCDMCVLYVWSENNKFFAPLTKMWKINKNS